MDYVKPSDVLDNMLKAGVAKAALSPKDLLIRGFLSGALLGISTSLAQTAAIQTNLPIVGALVFPVGFVLIVLLGLELVTGSFALVPLGYRDGKTSMGRVFSNLTWVFVGNLLGSLFYAALLYCAMTNMGGSAPDALGQKFVAIAEAKTLGYAKFGFAGVVTCFTKAILCNWMVTLGVVAAMTSTSTVGKIAAAWLPIFIFFAQGFEHSVVNMFAIPLGMMLGAKPTVLQWWLWNQIPVTLGNFFGGYLFTGLALYLTLKPKPMPAPEPRAVALDEVMAK
jgi:formate/nitrite transporter